MRVNLCSPFSIRLGLLVAVLVLVPAATALGCGGGDDNDSGNQSANTDASTGGTAGQRPGAQGGPGGRGRGGGGFDMSGTPVAVAEVRRGSIPRLLRSSGRLRARRVAEIAAGLGGDIHEVHVELGQAVERNEVLATFDIEEYARNVAEAEITLEQRKSEQRRSELQLQHSRTELARAADDSAPEGYDTDLFTVDEFERLRLNSREAEVNLELAGFNLRSAEIALDRARRDYERCYVRAPFAGVISLREVKAFDRVGQGDVLFELVDISDLELRIRVTEGEAASVRPGQPAIIASRGRVPLAYPAEVARVSPVVDVEDGVVEILLQVLPWQGVQGVHLWGQHQQLMQLISGPIPGVMPALPFVSPGATPPLRPGMFVGVEIATAVHPDAVLCPKEALQYDGDQPYVYAVREGRGGMGMTAVRTRLVLRTDFSTPEAVLVESGLEPGDRVVVRQADLRDGAPIRIVDMERR